MTGLRVAVLAGGPSSEAAVSRASAAAVEVALQRAGHSPAVLPLSSELPAALRGQPYDVVFPVTHGPLGEDGCVQGLLEVLDLPYVGSGVMASAIAASKPHAKTIFRAAGVPVAPDAIVRRGEHFDGTATRLRRELGQALVVKPASGGSAIGVTRVAGAAPDAAVTQALQSALDGDPVALVEPLVDGSEVTCGVLELDERGPFALPPTLIVARAAEFYSFEAKYARGGSEHRCPAGFPDELTQRIQQAAVAAHRAVGARDLSRVDFIVGSAARGHALTTLELNTLPGMTETSLYPEAALAFGIDFATLCDGLVRRAHARPRRSIPDVVPIPPPLTG